MEGCSQNGSSCNKANVVVELQKIQEKHGYLPRAELVKVSRRLKIPAVHIYGVATFYSQFKLEQPAKYIISVCEGTACHVRGSVELLNEIKKQADIVPSETSEDGLFTLEIVRCLGLCASAPVMTVNGKIYSKVKKEEVKDILAEYKKSKKVKA